jgi:catechol 2,3-dioxygenase-like lactoylglutathione lyase family enzyme
MSRALALVTYLVHDYEESLDYFTKKLGFSVKEDISGTGGDRWLVLTPGLSGTSAGANILIAKASTESEKACVGKQFGGRVGFILETTDFYRDFNSYSSAGVRFKESPRVEVYGTVAVFEDLYGNTWDLIQRV